MPSIARDTGPSPLLARRGGCASKKKVRSIRSGADGVVVQVQKHFRFLNHHPVRSIKGSFAMFLLMSRPPLLARRGYVAVRQPAATSSTFSAKPLQIFFARMFRYGPCGVRLGAS